jgi:phosphoglycolate phosphatase-like HAD superfamily hydrolase
VASSRLLIAADSWPQGVEPGQALLIGDGLQDIHAARAAGMACCAVTWGLERRERLAEAGPDFTVHDVRELAALLATAG